MSHQGNGAARAAARQAWARTARPLWRARGVHGPQALADVLGCRPASAGRMWHGEAMPGATLPAMAAWLGMDPAAVLALGQEPPRDTSHDEWARANGDHSGPWHRIVERRADGYACGCGRVLPATSQTQRALVGRACSWCEDAPGAGTVGAAHVDVRVNAGWNWNARR